MPTIHTNDKGEICGTRWSKEEIDYVLKNYTTETIGDIAKALNRTYNGVWNKVRKEGFKKVLITGKRVLRVIYKGQEVQKQLVNGERSFTTALKNCYYNTNPALRRGEKIVIEIEYE
jgi:hypothetical protein